MNEKTSFFSSITGLLTGLATLITAIGGLTYAISDADLIKLIGKIAPTEEARSKQGSRKTTDGWTVIGKYKRGKYVDLKLNAPGDSPAIGRKYDATADIRLVQRRPDNSANKNQVNTLGMIHRGESVEVLDLHIESPSAKKSRVWAKLRAVIHSK